jgi:CDP-diacylglycerol--serine O-phosphatidyltransferase
MKKIHLVPNILTAFALICGLFVIFKVAMIPPGQMTEQVLIATAGLLVLAGLLDFLDGTVARIMRAESDFGGIFDSMADAVSWGVAPSVIVLKTMSFEPGTFESFLVIISCLVYSVCTVMRLVRFNILAKKAMGNHEMELAHQQNFTGLPSPAAAASIVSLNLLLLSPDFSRFFKISEDIQTAILFVAMNGVGYCMVSKWKFPSFKRLRLKVSSFQVIFIIVFLAAFVFYGLLNHFAVVFFAISWSYIILGWILSLARIIAGRKSKALEDFEPESDDLEEEENE